MYTYMTHGSEYYMNQLIDKHPERSILEFKGQDDIVLYEETEQNTVFSAADSFTVVDSIGDIDANHPLLLRYFQVTEEQQKVAESHFVNQKNDFDAYEGFKAYRFLRPVKGQNYCVVFQFDSINLLEDFTKSSVYRDNFDESQLKSYQSADFISNVNFTRFLHTMNDELPKDAEE